MKKTVFTLMLMLASALAINAQSLTSNPWYMLLPLDDQEVVFMLNFNDDGTCAVAMAADLVMDEDGMKMTISFTAKVPGTYTLNGKNLKMTLNEDNADMDIDYEIEGVDAATKKMMDAMIKPELEKQKSELKKEIFRGVPNLGNMTIVSVSKDKLVLVDEAGEEMTFMPAPEK
mgnify:CR=1 FL=1